MRIRWLYQLEPGDEARFGVTSVALARVARTGVLVRPGFSLAAGTVHQLFLQPSLQTAIERALADHDHKKPELLAGSAQAIRRHLEKLSFPAALKQELAAFLTDLAERVTLDPKSPLHLTLTWEGQEPLIPHAATTAEIKTPADFEKAFRALLLPFFETKALHARITEKVTIMPTPAAVRVEYAPVGEAAGTVQTYDPEHHDGKTITITAHYHESERVGRVSAADVYRFDKTTLAPLTEHHARHRWSEHHDGRHRKPQPEGHHDGVLTPEQRLALARLGKRAQTAFPETCLFAWSLARGHLFITNVTEQPDQATTQPSETNLQGLPIPLVLGQTANLGSAAGTARSIRTPADQARIQTGDIAIVKQVAAHDYEWLAGVRGVICELGNHTAAEQAVFHTLGVPAISGAVQARRLIGEGQLITLDGTHGAVYAGRVDMEHLEVTHYTSPQPITGTHITVILPDALHIAPEQLEGADGVGLIRGEFLLEMLGAHPSEVVRKGLVAEYQDILRELLERAARTVYPHTVTYQLHDLREDSFLHPNHRHEPNPKLGYRGTHRLLREPELVTAEITVLAKLAEQGLGNVTVLLPCVRTLDEVVAMEQVLRAQWPATEAFPELWVRCETPALAIAAEDLCHLPIEGVVFDVPALTELITGLDRENYQVAHHVDQREQAVLDALHYAIATCRTHGLHTVILAEGEELAAEVVDEAVRSGVSEVCVTPAEVGEVRHLVASIEQRLLVEHVLEPEQPEPPLG